MLGLTDHESDADHAKQCSHREDRSIAQEFYLHRCPPRAEKHSTFSGGRLVAEVYYAARCVWPKAASW